MAEAARFANAAAAIKCTQTSGPVVVEANRYWDPQNMERGMGARLRFMAARTDRFRYA